MIKQKNLLYLFLTACMLAGFSFPSKGQMVDPVSWTYSVKQVNDSIFELNFYAAIEPTWHMYSQIDFKAGNNPASFKFEPTANYQRLDTVIEVTKASEEFDPMFGKKVAFFALEAKFTQRIKALAKESFKITGTIDYQICDDHSCSLGDEEFSFNVIPSPESAKTETDRVIATNGENTGSGTNSVSTIAETKPSGSSKSLWSLFWIAFGSGLIALLTPCVFPMIPMTVSFFMSSSKSKTGAKLNALFYGVSIIVIYTFIGVLVTLLFGPDFIKNVSSHWVTNLIFFLLFTAFAASFFSTR